MKIRLLPLLAMLTLLALLGGRPAHAAGSIRIAVSPNVLLADGISTAIVTAEIRTSGGRPARDGTEVRFYTTAGTVTQVAFTSAGFARATLTSSAVPQTANISVSAGLDQAIVSIPMVSKLVEASVGGRVMKIKADYVAFSEDKRFIQADQQVVVVYRGVTMLANSVQIDLTADTIKALGKVELTSDDKTLMGDRVWLDLKSFEGYLLAVGTRQWFSAYGLTELPEKPKKLNPDFDLIDLSDSKLLWVGKSANYVVGERVQVQGARAYVSGIKSMRMPYHEANLRGGFGDTSQYVGVGSEGLTLDIPFYLRMKPESSTALRVGFGSREGGIGNFTRDRGLRVDLVQKYGFAGASEGEASVTNLSSLDRWGFSWNHVQQLNKTTRLVSNLQFPEHRDLYGQLNLTAGMPLGTVQVALAGSKFRNSNLAKTVSLGFETKPRPLADGKLNASIETRFYERDAGNVRVARGVRVPVQSSQYQMVGLKLRPQAARLSKSMTLEGSTSLRAVGGGVGAGLGPAFESQLRKQLPNNGYLSLGLNYNHLATVDDFLPSTGKTNSTFFMSYPVTNKLRISALANMALDAESRNSLAQLSYQVAPGWRLEMLHSMFKFGNQGNFDYQFGISRAIGNRDLSVYWSRREHRFIVEFGAARF